MQESSLKNTSARSYYIAIGILVLLVVWMMSGALKALDEKKVHPPAEHYIPTVQTQVFPLLEVENKLKVFGRTEPDRDVRMKSEISGKVLSVNAAEGEMVKKGQLLLTLDKRDLPARLQEAKLKLKQRIAEKNAANNLHQKSYTSDVELASANALVAEAAAELKRLQLSLKDTQIVAPFSGVVQKRFVEVGDFVAVGVEVIQLVDLDPLVVHVDISERRVAEVKEGMRADISTLNNEAFTGKVRYIGALSQTGTNTFPAEIIIENNDMSMPAGISTQVELHVGKAKAIQVTPAVLAIDETGNIGVKSVVGNIVKFTPAMIVKSDQDAMWLNGFDSDTHIITRGQGFVKDGMEVKEVLEGSQQ